MKTSEVHSFIKDIVAALCKNADIKVWSNYHDRVWSTIGKVDFHMEGFGIKFVKESEDDYGEIHFGKFVDGYLDSSEGYTGTILDSSFKSDTEEAQRIANIIHSYTIENATTKGKRQMTKKYELTDETKVVDGHTLHRIRALKDFGNVKAGDLGGWVESEKNLRQKGKCWVYDNAVVFENAEVRGNARVYEDALVCGNAEVFGNAKVYGISKVAENAQVTGNARVFGYAWVFGNATVEQNAKVYGNAFVYDKATVFGNAKVFEDAKVYGNAWVYENAEVCGNAKVYGNSKVFGNAWFHGNAEDEEEAEETEKQEALERLQRAGIVDENGELAKEYRTEEEPEKNEDNEPEPTALACSDFPTREELDELNEIGIAGIMKKQERQERWYAIWFWVKVSLISVCGGVVGAALFRWLLG